MHLTNNRALFTSLLIGSFAVICMNADFLQHVANVFPIVVREAINDDTPIVMKREAVFPETTGNRDEQVAFSYHGDLVSDVGKWSGTARHQDSGLSAAIRDYGGSRDGCREEAGRQLALKVRAFFQAEEHKQAQNAHQVNILFMSAGSGQGIMSDEELNHLQTEGRLSTGDASKLINIKHFAAAGWTKISDELKVPSFRAAVVHIAAHSSPQGVELHSINGGPLETASADFLGGVFRRQAKGQIKLVILSGCTNQDVAESIVPHVPFVVSTLIDISNQQAINFSGQLYRRIAAGESIRVAFEDAHAVAKGPAQGAPDVYKLLEQTVGQPDIILTQA